MTVNLLFTQNYLISNFQNKANIDYHVFLKSVHFGDISLFLLDIF